MRAVALLLFAVAVARADTLVLKDARFVDGVPIERTRAGYVVHYENGDVHIPEAMVSVFFKEGGEHDWVPETEEEKAKAEKGLMPWGDRWIRKSYRKKLIKKEVDKQRKRVEQMKARRLWRNRAILKSKHYDFEHTLPDEIFVEFLDLLEVYRSYYLKFWKFRPSPKFGRPTVLIFNDREQYYQVAGIQRGAVGFYMPSDRTLHFFFDRDLRDLCIAIMIHEASHLMTHMVDQKFRYPAWLNEGMAEYFGSAKWNPEKKVMEVGHVQSGRLAVLASFIEDDQWQGLESLLRTPRINAPQYAWAWSFCHFLMTEDRYGDRFKKYFLDIARSKSIKKRTTGIGRTVDTDVAIEALKRYLKVKDLKELEKEWHTYVKDYVDAGDLDWKQAGYFMSLYGEHKKARLFFKKAIDKVTKSPLVYYHYARLQFDRGRWGVAMERVKTALELDPLYARAHSLLGRCMWADGDRDKGKKEIELALELAPDDNRIWYDQAEVEMAEQKEKEAGG